MRRRLSENAKKRQGTVSVKIIAIILLLVFPLNLIALLEVRGTIRSAISEVQDAHQNMANLYAGSLTMRMNNAASLLQYFQLENEDCIRMTLQTEIEYPYQSSKAKFYSTLKRMAQMTNGADGYFYYMNRVDDILVYSEPYIGLENTDRLKEMVSGEAGESFPLGWHIYEETDRQYLLLLVSLKNVSYGAWIDLDEIQREVTDGLEYEKVSVVFSEMPNEEAGKDQLSVSAHAKKISLTIFLSRNEILQGLTLYQKGLIASVFPYLLLIPVLFIVIRRLLIIPLNEINLAHREFQNGNQEYRLPDQSNSKEYTEAFQSFNSMADNMKLLQIQSYEREIDRQKTELRNLQLQIRPHFLLNTFNLIYTLAQRKEIDSIQNITIYLSNYFRYIFRSEKDLEIFTKELNLINGYMQMISIRYKQRVELTCDLDPEISLVRTPPLLIHNFIENSVKHGLMQDRRLHIQLQGRYMDRRVVFTVMDDGNGMSEEVLLRNQRIFRGELVPDDKSEHLGLYNSYKRLKYYYGEGARIDVTSEMGVMTCFTIDFPYDMEESDEASYGE